MAIHPSELRKSVDEVRISEMEMLIDLILKSQYDMKKPPKIYAITKKQLGKYFPTEEEVEALRSIYGEAWSIEISNSYSSSYEDLLFTPRISS